jgi:GTPase SAR1 family protein
MSTERTRRRIPDIPFRVLVIGRANAGKTSILQRVCDTTESPTVYRRRVQYGEREEVRCPNVVCEFDLTTDQVKLDPSMDVGDNRTSLRLPIDMVPARRAQHRS